MALQDIFYSEFKSSRGYQYKVTIWEDGGVATREFDLGGDGFILNYSGDENDLFSPVIGSEVTIPFYVETVAQQSFVEAIPQAQEQKYFVEIEIHDGSTYQPFWRGLVLQDLIEIEDFSQPYICNIKATDGIGRLKYEEYSNSGTAYTGKESLLAIVRRCLTKIGHSDLWGTTDQFLAVAISFFEKNTYTTTPPHTTISTTRIKNAAFMTEDENGQEFFSCYDVLMQILLRFGARIMMYKGMYNIISMPYYSYGTATLVHIKTYTKTSASTSYTVGFYMIGLFDILGGNTFNYNPALRKAICYYNYRHSEYTESFIPPNWPYSLTAYETIEGGADQKLKLSGGVATYYTGSLTQEFRLRVKITMYVGSNWLQGENGVMAWVASTSVYYYAYTQVIFTGSNANQIEFITPNIPADGQLNFGVEVDAAYDTAGNSITMPTGLSHDYNFQLQYITDAQEIGEGQRKTYAVNYEAGTSTEVGTNFVYEIPELVISDAENTFDVGGLEVETSPSVWQDSSEWSDGSSPYYTIDELLCREIIGLARTPKQIYNLTITYIEGIDYVFMNIHYPLLIDSILYAPCTIEFRANMDEWSGTWLEVGRVVSDIGSGVDLVPVGSPFSYDSSYLANSLEVESKYNWLNATRLSKVTTAITAGSNLSSIDIEQLDSGSLKEGDIITLVNPFDNRSEDVIVNRDVNNADTTVTIVSHTFTNNYPENSSIIISNNSLFKKFQYALPRSIETKTSDYTIVNTDYTILADASSRNVRITLPAAVDAEGLRFIIKCIDSTNSCIVESADNIDGAATITLSKNEAMTVQSDGSTYYIISN